MLQGPFPRYFHISGILAFSLGMQTCWNVQSEPIESRGPIPSLPTPRPAHHLLLSIFSSHSPCISPSSPVTLPPASYPWLAGAQVGGETKTGFITGIEKQPETRARAMADLPGMGGSASPDAGRLEAWVPMALANNPHLFSFQPCSLPCPWKLRMASR